MVEEDTLANQKAKRRHKNAVPGIPGITPPARVKSGKISGKFIRAIVYQ